MIVCITWCLGLAVAGFGAYVHFHEEPGKIPNALRIVGGVMSIVGDDAYAAMTPTLYSPKVGAVGGMVGIDRAVAAFPDELTRRVVVVPPQSDGVSTMDILMFGAVGGVLLGSLDRWSDEKTRKKVAELVDKNLVRDAELGTSLLEFCRQRGWELAIE